MKLRDRMIYAGLVTSDMKRRHPAHIREFYRDLLHCCDDHGRFEADPALLRAVLYVSILDRVSARDVQSYLHALHLAGDIKLYTVRGRGYGKVTKWRQTRLKNLVAEYPPEEDEPQLALGVPEPPTPLKRKERKKEVSGARSARDTRHAELCAEELQQKFPHHDIAACLRRAKHYVQRERGSSATVSMGWFVEHWMPNESAAAAPKITSHDDEPANWREWCREHFPDFTGLGSEWAQLDTFQKTFIRDRIKRSA